MTTDYNVIAEEYKRSKQQPWRLHIEAFTLFELIGPLAGRAVVDLACGEGFYTRIVKQRGAERVLGVDLSERMIELARAEEQQRPLGVDYLVQDARQLDLAEPVDLIVAAYLLNYASTREELRAMCRAIGRNLKPGCRFVTVNNNPTASRADFLLSAKYGFVRTSSGDLCEGAPIEWKFFLEHGEFTITNYHLSVATHEWAFREAGFEQIRWHAPRLAPEQDRNGYWSDFLDHPPITFIECVRAGKDVDRDRIAG